MQTPFDYGAGVELIDVVDIARFGITEGSACGFRSLDAVQAMLANLPEGTVLVLVEGENGASVEIPRSRLKPI
jgi:hypothetical protein